MQRTLVLVLAVMTAACGPDAGRGGDDSASCSPGERDSCYSGQDGTEGVGPCRGGTRTCETSGTWGPCTGEVIPSQELCTDGVDNNCSGETDENVDEDGDGVTTCGGDCCDSTECTNPGAVNSGSFDAPGNNFDDDCNGVVDDAQLLCDQNLSSASQNALDYAKAIDICQTATMTEKKWGVISATLTLADGTGTPAGVAQSIRPRFGPGVLPKGGTSLALFSTGHAAAMGDQNPPYQDFQSGPIAGNGRSSGFPADFVMLNSGSLPNAPNCPGPMGTTARDPVMLTLTIRVPSNAKSFRLATNFFSSEFPEYTCSPFNDFFVVLLDSTYTGTPANPMDKNLAFYETAGMKYPVGVNLASGNTGLFQQCVNGPTGCRGMAGSISTCTSTAQLMGTGLDTPSPGACDANALQGGGTGWLETTGNVTPGEIMKLRIAIWDTSDNVLDSIAVVDGFQWGVDVAQPGTVIFRQAPSL
ncbi:MAG: choice-of-anchor L domain-containing protein [Kofleriaceae bacterium]